MKFTIQSGDLENQAKVTLIIGVFEKGELPPASKRIDKKSGGFLSKILKNGDFNGKCGETFLLLNVPAIKAQVLLVGCGANTTLNIRDYRKITAASVKTVQNASATHLISFLPELHVEKLDLPAKIKQAVQVCSNALYNFDDYKSQKQPPLKLKEITFSIADKKTLKAAQTALNQAIAIATGVTLTKNLANMPSNICTPVYLADAAKKLAKRYRSISVKVLEEKDMKKLGMGAFLSVTKGSRQNAKLVALEYKGSGKKSAPVALVGKGITFDTGGISLKPSDAMIGMKYDMCGAAAVLGTLQAVADLKLPIHVVGILAIAENMPGGGASKPEDIVKTMAGINVEILNTDAEGRLVLCDALTYTERYKPAAVIDIATLTGAVVVALGHHATGLLANNDALAKELLDAGNETYDRAWPLPLWDEYQEQIRSPFADIANTGGKGAGTITAACFLSRFTKKFAWAHLDVAGTAAMMMGLERYATGRPVPLLTQYLINRSEKKLSNSYADI